MQQSLSSRIIDKAGLKPVSSATETRKNIGISFVASLFMMLSKREEKGADQSARICRLVFALLFTNPEYTFPA